MKVNIESLVTEDTHTLAPIAAADGTAHITSRAEEVFLQWLKDNGAKWSAIDWPSRATVGGIRGAVATRNIESGETMVQVPSELLLSVERARACPIIGEVIADLPHMFSSDEDKTLAVYVMNEKVRGEASFWKPYFDIIPYPATISDWREEELQELQNEYDSMFSIMVCRDTNEPGFPISGPARVLLESAIFRTPYLHAQYDSMMNALIRKRPDLFSRESHSFLLFKWSWCTIQARAFGRRLPWTALVPLADCLNHSNVAATYSYDVETGTYRLFPGHGNRYEAGAEAFNSYGRRDNGHLLKEYGFAIEDNEWERVGVEVRLPRTDSTFLQKLAMLSEQCGQSNIMLIPISWNLSRELLHICRILALTDLDMTAEASGLAGRTCKPVVSAENEGLALSLASHAVESMLSCFPTTLEHDITLLARLEKIGEHSRLKTALVYRMTRKRLLRRQLQHLRALAEALAGTTHAIEVPVRPAWPGGDASLASCSKGAARLAEYWRLVLGLANDSTPVEDFEYKNAEKPAPPEI